MPRVRILVVEDEIFVAAEIESVVEEMGYSPAGIAGDSVTALTLAAEADVALIDLNLLDGPTGPSLGRILAEKFGLTVVFMTANPSQLGDGVPGTLGVIGKPLTDSELKQAVNFAVATRSRQASSPPSRMQIFQPGNLTFEQASTATNG